MYALAPSIGWLITTCLLIVLFLRALREQDERHDAERKAHREEIAGLHQARVEEIANLCQRIQAPEQAAATHAATNALPDPAPLNIEDDSELLANREAMLRQFGVLPEYEIAEAE